MNLQDLIEQSDIAADDIQELKKKIKEELKYLSQKSNREQLNEDELKRQHLLNKVKDKIRDYSNSSNEVMMTNEKTTSDLMKIVTDLIHVQNNEQKENHSIKQHEILQHELSTFKTSMSRQFRKPKITSTSIFTAISSLFLLPKNFFEGTWAYDFFLMLDFSVPIIIIWFYCLIFMILTWFITYSYEESVQNIIMTVGSDNNMKRLFKMFLRDRVSYSDTFTVTEFTSYLIDCFQRQGRDSIMLRLFKRKHRKVFSNPELLQAIEHAAQLQTDKAFENDVLFVESKGIDIIYGLNNI